MKCAVIALMLAILMQPMQPGGARADGSPAWTGRAKRIVARIHVPPRDNVSEHDGTGFFVGFKDQTAYLITAGHVIWPNGLPPSENVKLQMKLPDCEPDVPGVADAAQASVPSVVARGQAISPAVAEPPPPAVSAVAGSPEASQGEELDLALVKIYLADVPNEVRTRCHDVLAHLRDLPRHIVDPDGDSLAENTRAWLIGRSAEHEGVGVTPFTFTKHGGDLLQFKESFTPGDSGAPVFSDRGYIIGMAIKNASQTGGTPETGEATKFGVILRKLHFDWEVPTNVAGSYSRLSFNDLRGALLSIDRAPDVELRLPHPAPLGPVVLKLRISDTQEVTDTVDVEGAEMNCDVTISRWLARHRRPTVYMTLGLVAVTGGAFVAARMSRNSFDRSPSSSGYAQVRAFNAITIGTGSAALASVGASVASYFLSDRTGIICHEVPR